MSAAEYTIYDAASGEALQVLVSEPEILHLDMQPGQSFAAGRYDPGSGYFSAGEWVEYTESQAAAKADRPSYWHRWSNTTMSWHDIRDLAAQKAAKWEEIKAARDASCVAPLAVAGHVFDFDDVAQARLSKAHQLASLSAPGWSVTWTLADNSSAELTAPDLAAVIVAGGARTDAAFATGRALRSAIDACTDATQLASIAWPVSM